MGRNILGPRIREKRRELGITQAELARKLDISAPYLNLIEHNKRVISGGLLSRVAHALQLPLEQLDGASDRRLLDSLLEVGNSPEAQASGVDPDSVGEFIGRFPAWAETLVGLSKKEQKATRISKMLGDRLSHDPFLSETVHNMLTHTASLRSAAEIIEQYPDLEGEEKGRFNKIILEESESLGKTGDALASYFDNAAQAKRKLTPLDEIDDWFDLRQNHFHEIESRSAKLYEKLASTSPSQKEEVATSLTNELLGSIIEKLIANESALETKIARNRAIAILKEYARNAILVPIHQLGKMAIENRYDAELLAEYFNVDFGVICERLSALHGNHNSPRFGYYRSNAAGTLLRSRNLPGINPAKYGSACPLWLLFRAQQTPMTTLRQLVQLPDGDRFVFVARASAATVGGFNAPTHFNTDMLVIQYDDASETVYAPRPDVPVESVGISCRGCPRDNCEQRALDPFAG